MDIWSAQNLRILIIVFIAFFAWAIVQLLTKGFVTSILVGSERGKRLRTLTNLVKSSASIVIAAVAAVMVLQEMGFNIAPLIASAGIVGLAIGFGAQTLVKDVIAEIKFKTGGKLNNNIVAPISHMIKRLLMDRGYVGAINFHLKPHDSFRDRTRLSGSRFTEFIGRYGPVANTFDEEARVMLANDQALYDTFITSCKDAVEYCKKYPPTWKISVKDIIHMTRLKYRIEDRVGRRHYVLFGNSMVTYIANMMVHDVPELKELANGPRKLRKKHDLDAEAELVVPEALIGALQ